MDGRWRVHVTRLDLPTPAVPMEFVTDLAGGWRDWSERSGDPEGVPFVMSPQLDFDVELNAFFTSAQMLSCSPNCQNVALSGENTRALTSELDTLTQHLASGSLPPLLARHLASRRDELAHLLRPDQDKNDSSDDHRPDQRRDH